MDPQHHDSSETIPDKATWDYWPLASTGDFARLIPVSPDARLAFQAAVERMLANSNKAPWPYSTPFIHYECTDLDTAERRDILESSPEPEVPSGSGRLQPTSVQREWTGYYRLNMRDPKPENIAEGWVMGAGRKDKNVEFILTTPERKSEDKTFGRHARLRRSLDSGAVIVTTDSHPILVDGYELSRRRIPGEDPVAYQRVAGSNSVIMLGRLTYRLQMQELRPEIDRAQLDEARRSLGYVSGSGPSFFLTPTPAMPGNVVGDYLVFEPFASGSMGTVHFVTHLATGFPYALKKIKNRGQHDHDEIQNEVKLLRKIKHVGYNTSVY